MHVIGPAGDDVARLFEACEKDWERRIEPIRRKESDIECFDAGAINATMLRKIKKDFVEVSPVDGFSVYVRILDCYPGDEYPFLFEDDVEECPPFLST
jgi:hypothetical protein